jgi:asparagine synthase (glutamine-hydrolysing)
MDTFVCLVNTRGGAVSPEVRRRYTLGHSSAIDDGWLSVGPCSMRVTNDGCGPASSILRGPLGIGVGIVRLDNRREIRRELGMDPEQSDMALIAAALHRRGVNAVGELQGDFSFAHWNTERAELIVARDFLGVRTLYRAQDGDIWAFGSRATWLGQQRELSLEYIADYIAFNYSRRGTPYAGVFGVAPGTACVLTGRRMLEHRYWSPYQFSTDHRLDSNAAVEQFRPLFVEAVRLRLTGEADCWAQLSGGLDSSSVVSTSQWLAKHDSTVHGLAGTLSFVDTLGTGDERRYSDAVIRDWPLPNAQLIDYGLWQDGDEPPPMLDMPIPGSPSFALHQQACRIIRSGGGRVLLTGVGPDQMLFGNYVYFADWLLQGRIKQAARDMFHLAALGRGSFWKFAYENAVRPLFGRPAPKRERWPVWVRPAIARRFAIHERSPRGWSMPARPGRYFSTDLANNVALLEYVMTPDLIDDSFDIRHPFLHRPLVEFCLQLSSEVLARPREQKWILRQAMRGILPDEVRLRKTKGFINARIRRSFNDEHERLNTLLDHSILAEIGCIDARLAKEALANIGNISVDESARLRHTLTLEMWLTVRSGRWIARDVARPTSAVA